MIPNFLMTGRMPRPSMSFHVHRHTFWEVVLYTQGEGTATVGGKKIAFRAGTVICNPPGVAHGEVSETGYQNRWVALEELQAGPEGEVPVLHFDIGHPIFLIASILHEESHLHKPTSAMIVQNLFSTFLIYLNEHLAHDPHERLMLQLKRIFGANVQNPTFRIADAFSTIPLSRDHARRLFVERVGVSPVRYLTDLRMGRAKELLQMGFSVKETADKVGIPDQYYFSRLFKKTQGVSPSVFRVETGGS